MGSTEKSNADIDAKQDDDQHSFLHEGKIVIKTGKKTFYNPAQVVNRDLSVAVIAAFFDLINDVSDVRHKALLRRSIFENKTNPNNKNGEKIGLTILDGLSSTGIRAIRYAKEIKGVNRICANDLNTDSVKKIKENIALNEAQDSIKCSYEDINDHMYLNKNNYNVIDIDPYGTASPFLYNSVGSIQDGGLLCVTSTDMRNFSGNNPETCWSNYGSMPLKSKYCHELALRILLSAIDRAACTFKRHIIPLASFCINFYVRVFVRVIASPIDTKTSCCKNGMLFVCTDCNSFVNEKMGVYNGLKKAFKATRISQNISVCNICDGKYEMIGPIWLDKLHSNSFLEKVIPKAKTLELKEEKRVFSLVKLAMDEVPDSVLYHDISKISRILGISCPPLKVVASAIKNGNYKISRSHVKASYIKTNAPCEFLWGVFKKICEETKAETKSVIGVRIFSKILRTDVDLTLRNVKELFNTEEEGKKFVDNEANWGPKKKAKVNNIIDSEDLRDNNNKK